MSVNDFMIIQKLQSRYCRALDKKDMQAWLNCFAKDGSYALLPADNVEQGLPMALMLDDTYERLQDRVTYIAKVWQGTFEDYQTRHFVQEIEAIHEDGNLYRVESNVSVFFTGDEGDTRILASGIYEDLIRIEGEQAVFVQKRVVIDTFVPPRYIVYPI